MSESQTSGLALLDNVADFALSGAKEETSAAAKSVVASALVTDNVDKIQSVSLANNSPAPVQQQDLSVAEITAQEAPTTTTDITPSVEIAITPESTSDAANEGEFDGDKYKRLLEGGGKLTEKEVRALINHLEKLITAGNLSKGQGLFTDTFITQNRETILDKAKEIHGEIAGLLQIIFDAFYIAPEKAEEKAVCEEEARKARNKKANMMDQVAVAGLK